MKAALLWSLLRSGRLRLLGSAVRLLTPFHRLSFIAAASQSGLLKRLAFGPLTFSVLAAELAPDPTLHASLRAWLGLGVRLGELSLIDDNYRLKGFLSRQLANPDYDEVSALFEEVANFHHQLIVQTPARLKAGKPWQFTDHDGELIARSSRIMEPFLFEVLDSVVPTQGTLRLLEVGCGAGHYLQRAAERNPQLTARGIELQASVAEATRAQVARWGLADRIAIDTADIRSLPAHPDFDLVTLYNAIYYFPVAERVTVLRQLGGFLTNGGKLVVTSSCRGGSPGIQILDLWLSSVPGLGPLPSVEELTAQVTAAGFSNLEIQRPIPGEKYVAVIGTWRGPGQE